MRGLGVALLAAACLAAGCSGSGTGGAAASGKLAGGHPDSSAACALITKLDAAGDVVRHADIKDPPAFDAAMSRATAQYVHTLDALRKVVPASLEPHVDRLRAAVDQYRFADGVDDHAALDDYAHRSCN